MSLLLQDTRLARRVGAIALLVMAAVSAGFVFLLDRLALGSPVRIQVMFRHTAGLREHAPLIVAGQPVGSIQSITPRATPPRATPPRDTPPRADQAGAGEIGVVVTVAVHRGDAWKVPARAQIFVASRGPLSEKYLEVAPPPGDPGPAIRDGQELRGIDPPSVDRVLQNTWTNMTIFREFVEAVRPEATALRGELERLRERLAGVLDDPRAAGGIAGLVDAMRELVEAARHTHDVALGGDAGLARIAATVRHARAALAEARAAFDVLGPKLTALAASTDGVRGHLAASATFARAEQAIAALRAALDKLDPLLANADGLAALIASGEGSVGRLMKDPEFPEDAKDLGKILKRRPWRIIQRPRD